MQLTPLECGSCNPKGAGPVAQRQLTWLERGSWHPKYRPCGLNVAYPARIRVAQPYMRPYAAICGVPRPEPAKCEKVEAVKCEG